MKENPNKNKKLKKDNGPGLSHSLKVSHLSQEVDTPQRCLVPRSSSLGYTFHISQNNISRRQACPIRFLAAISGTKLRVCFSLGALDFMKHCSGRCVGLTRLTWACLGRCR